MSRKLGALNLDSATAEKLFKAGLISKETYNKVAQHFASGGEVEEDDEPSPIEQALSGVTQTPNMSPAPSQEAQATPVTTETAQRAPSSDFDLPSPPVINPGDLMGTQVPKPAPAEASPPPPSVPSAQPSGPDPMQQAQQKMMAQVAQGYDKAFGDMTKGAMASAGAAAKEAAAESSYWKETANQLEQMKQQAQDSENFRQTQLTSENNKLAELRDAYVNKAAIDPNRFWNDKSTIQKIGIALGVALSGAGGHGSQALDLINNAINRDIDAQKANLNKTKEGFELENNIYANMLKQFGDQRQAEAATRLISQNILESQLKQIQAKYKGPIAQAQAAHLLGQIELQKAQYQQQFAQSMLSNPAFMQQDDTRRKINMLPKDDQVAARKEWGEYQDMQSKIKATKENFQTMYDNRLARFVPGTDGYSKYDAANSTFDSAIKDIFGRASEFELKVIKGWKPKATDSDEVKRYKMGLLQKKIETEASSSFPTLRDYGILPKPIDFVGSK